MAELVSTRYQVRAAHAEHSGRPLWDLEWFEVRGGRSGVRPDCVPFGAEYHHGVLVAGEQRDFWVRTHPYCRAWDRGCEALAVGGSFCPEHQP